MNDTQRIAPLPLERWDDEHRAALHLAFPDDTVARFLSTGPDAIPLPDAITAMMHHPELAGAWLAFNNVLLWNATLEPRLRELMVLRVAWNTRSNYEWIQHVALATRCGISPEEIDAIARVGGAGTWSPLEAALLVAADQLVDHYRVDDDTWAILAEHLDERRLVEVVFVVGAYTCLAMVFKSFGLHIEPVAGTTAALPEAETS